VILFLATAFYPAACAESRRSDPVELRLPPEDAGQARLDDKPALAQRDKPARSAPIKGTAAARRRPSAGDDGQQSLVPIRRLVYRATFVVPQPFRDRRSVLPPIAGELVTDISDQWIEGRFSGPAWPVPEGSAALVFRGRPGAMVYDGTGPRQLGSGRLASWFEGRLEGRSKSFLIVRREYGHNRTTTGPGDLLCALLAEWAAQPRDNVMRRCVGNVLPPGFRLGPWRAELTAVVPMSAPEPDEKSWKSRARLSAAPPPPAAPGNRPIMDPDEVATFIPARRWRAARPDRERNASLRFANNTSTSVMVIADGLPLGWVGSQSELLFEGLTPDRYRIGAVRPLGRLCHGPRTLTLPGEIVMGKPKPDPGSNSRPQPGTAP
jgi:hypothetical protein